MNLVQGAVYVRPECNGILIFITMIVVVIAAIMFGIVYFKK